MTAPLLPPTLVLCYPSLEKYMTENSLFLSAAKLPTGLHVTDRSSVFNEQRPSSEGETQTLDAAWPTFTQFKESH